MPPVSGSDVTSYTIRHSIATHLRARGVHQSEISEPFLATRCPVAGQRPPSAYGPDLAAGGEGRFGGDRESRLASRPSTCVPVACQSIGPRSLSP